MSQVPLKNLQQRIKEKARGRETEAERERETFIPLVNFPNVCCAQDGSGLKEDNRILIQTSRNSTARTTHCVLGSALTGSWNPKLQLEANSSILMCNTGLLLLGHIRLCQHLLRQLVCLYLSLKIKKLVNPQVYGALHSSNSSSNEHILPKQHCWNGTFLIRTPSVKPTETWQALLYAEQVAQQPGFSEKGANPSKRRMKEEERSFFFQILYLIKPG